MMQSWFVVPLVLLFSWTARAAPDAPGGAAPSPTASTAPRLALRAAQEIDWQEDADAYCRLVTGIAASESALLLSPRLFSTAGLFPPAGAPGGTTDMILSPRVVIGVSYSAANGYRGYLLRERARSRCVRQRLVSQLNAFIQANEGLLSRRALASKLRVLEAALPKAEEILGRTRTALEHGRATLDELGATELRVDQIRLGIEQARKGLALSAGTSHPRRPVAELLGALEAADVAIERYDAAVRRSYGWDAEIQGGYDQVIGAGQRVPAFAMIRTSISLGMLFSGGADDQAISARRSLARHDTNGLRGRVDRVLRALRATARAERARMGDTAVLLADLEARLQSVEAVAGEQARRYAEYLWFEVVRVKAEHEYLRVHVRDLAVVLDAASPHGVGRRDSVRAP